MVRGDIELIADTILIEKVIAIDYGFQKSAGVADTLKGALGSGMSAIMNGVRGEVDTTDTKTTIASISNIVATGALFKLWWPLGVINAVATSFFGINAITIAQKIWNIIKGALMSGKAVSPADVSEATKSVTAEMTSTGARHSDPFEIIRQAEREGKLFRLVKSAGPAKSGGLFEWLKNLNPFTGKSLIGGFIGWALKAALLGAGLLAVSGTAANLLGVNKKPDYEPSQPSGAAMVQEPEATAAAPAGLSPTGNGQGTHNQSPTTKWVVPAPGGSVSQMLLQWAAYVYHDFTDQSVWHAISSTPSFNKVVEELKRAQEPGSDQLTIPAQYKSVKQVVDQFAAEAKAKLKESNVKPQ